MKMNKKIIRLRRFAKSICHCERSAAILLGLALVLSLGIVAVPIIGTVEAWCEPNPTFLTKANTGDPATNISIEWSIDRACSGSHSVHVFTTAATTDYAMVGVVTDFVLTASTSISYLGYTVAGSDVKAPDEIWLEFTNGDVICNTHPGGTSGQWVEWTLSGSSNWYIPSLTPSPINIADYYDRTVAKIFLGAGSPTSAGVTVDVYLDNLMVDGITLLDDDTGEIDVLCGTFCGYTGDTGIQTAINAALLGDIINVAAGTYNERVVINKPLTLQGENRVTTIIDGTGMTAEGIPAYGNNGILIFPGSDYHTQDVGITISGFTVQNFAVIGAGAGAGIATDGTYQYYNITISDVILRDNGLIGLDLGRSLEGYFSDIVVNNNDQLGTGNEGYGIWLSYDSKDNEFTNIVAKNHDHSGIMVMQANNNSFSNVSCTGNNIGIYFYDSSDNTVENSSMSNNMKGVKCYSGVNNQIHCSNIEGNEVFGMESLVALDATNNWWGDASGPYYAITNPSTTGDAVSDNVNYNPWYTDEEKTILSNAIATLSDLTVDGTIITGFDSATLTYNKVLPYGTTEVPTVGATTTDSNATNVITQAVNVTGTEAQRTATVVVTAEDVTTTKTYKVIFGSIKVTITKTGPTTANQGNNIIYAITYKNVGTFNATNVVITETYPSEVSYILATPVPNIGNNKWTIPILAPNAEGTITVTVHIK